MGNPRRQSGKKGLPVTAEGMEALDSWIAYMRDQAKKLTHFVQTYRDIE